MKCKLFAILVMVTSQVAACGEDNASNASAKASADAQSDSGIVNVNDTNNSTDTASMVDLVEVKDASDAAQEETNNDSALDSETFADVAQEEIDSANSEQLDMAQEVSQGQGAIECYTAFDCEQGGGDYCVDNVYHEGGIQCLNGKCQPNTATWVCQYKCEDRCVCQKDTDCDDGNSATSDWCSADSTHPIGSCFNIETQKCVKDWACSDGDDCTEDKCVGGLCVNKIVSEIECDDGNWCTNYSVCKSGVCIGWVAEKGYQIPCDDGDACTWDDCNALKKKCGHIAISCDDGLSQTLDSCDKVMGCVHTLPECVTATDCEDGNICTDDSCDVANGVCKHEILFGGNVFYCELDGSNCTVELCAADGQCQFAYKSEAKDCLPCTTAADCAQWWTPSSLCSSDNKSQVDFVWDKCIQGICEVDQKNTTPCPLGCNDLTGKCKDCETQIVFANLPITSVVPYSTEIVVMKFTVTVVTGTDIELDALNFELLGQITTDQLTMMKLYKDGTQFGQASVTPGTQIYTNPLNSGTSIAGGSTAEFELRALMTPDVSGKVISVELLSSAAIVYTSCAIVAPIGLPLTQTVSIQ